MSIPIPDRSTLAGGLSGVLVWGVSYALQAYTGIVIPEAVLTPIVISIMTFIVHIVPDAQKVKEKADAAIEGLADFIPQVDFTYPEEKLEWNPNNLSKK